MEHLAVRKDAWDKTIVLSPNWAAGRSWDQFLCTQQTPSNPQGKLISYAALMGGHHIPESCRIRIKFRVQFTSGICNSYGWSNFRSLWVFGNTNVFRIIYWFYICSTKVPSYLMSNCYSCPQLLLPLTKSFRFPPKHIQLAHTSEHAFIHSNKLVSTYLGPNTANPRDSEMIRIGLIAILLEFIS